MQDRIWKMLDNFDAFITLLGGIGTLEKNFQIASWAQLNIHHKPISLLNVDGFFNKLLSFLDQVGKKISFHIQHDKSLFLLQLLRS
ncbi:hypothetical protein DITRI_Ditri14bG0034500 [Diplodiscus trichospermus]